MEAVGIHGILSDAVSRSSVVGWQAKNSSRTLHPPVSLRNGSLSLRVSCTGEPLVAGAIARPHILGNRSSGSLSILPAGQFSHPKVGHRHQRLQKLVHASAHRGWAEIGAAHSAPSTRAAAAAGSAVSTSSPQSASSQPEQPGLEAPAAPIKAGGKYERELEVARLAVQLSCTLSDRVQKQILRDQETSKNKKDKSLVTIADWGVQAVVAWVLVESFPGEDVSIVAEEDTDDLKGRDGFGVLQRVVAAVNEALSHADRVGLRVPAPLNGVDVLRLINRGTAQGGAVGRHWILDPVDGTLGFVRGDQYAVALAMMEEGEVVVGALGCPNLPMRAGWLRYSHRFHRLATAFFPPVEGAWYKGCVALARKGGGASIEPLLSGPAGIDTLAHARHITVSPVADPAAATFCEPVEKANSSHEYTAKLADNLGMRSEPLRVYSMAKYAAVARGDAEAFMKFARGGYREKIWDHAAGVIIVEEAGGRVTDAGGKSLDFSKGRFLEDLDRGIIATCGGVMHKQLLQAIDNSWVDATL